MKVIDYPSHDAYLAAQRGVRRNRKGPFFRPEEISAVGEWWGNDRPCWPGSAICHGVRCGAEMEAIRSHLVVPEVVGTDVQPRPDLQRTGLSIVHWDFTQPNPEWVGRFDLLWSNSLDHSPDPRAAVQVWMEQLRKDGRMFLQWDRNHTMLTAGNCFAGSLDEYVGLVEGAGRCLDLIYVPASGRCRWSAIVVGGRA